TVLVDSLGGACVLGRVVGLVLHLVLDLGPVLHLVLVLGRAALGLTRALTGTVARPAGRLLGRGAGRPTDLRRGVLGLDLRRGRRRSVRGLGLGGRLRRGDHVLDLGD